MCQSQKTFQLLRSNDLIWSSLTHEYLMGARVPIMLTNRAGRALARLASAAVAQLYVHHAKGLVK